MTIARFARLITSVLISTLLVVPVAAQNQKKQTAISNAVIESIEFEGVAPAQQRVVIERIGVRVGQVLTPDVMHRIGRGLEKGMTFSYKAGSRLGSARLVISADC
jgi:outer membrane protein assembly factor BamA